jgi:hypothetical protein
LVSTSRASWTEVTSTVELGFCTVQKAIITKFSARTVTLSTAIDTGFVAIANAIPALSARCTFATAVYVGFTQGCLPNAINTVIALWAIRSTTVGKVFSVVENAVVAVWWNLVIVVQAAGKESRSAKRQKKNT